jgi:hypothetical protein
VASAIIFFRTGDQHRHSRRRCTDGRREPELLIDLFDAGPVQLHPDDLPCMAATVLRPKALSADEAALGERYETSETHLVRGVLLRFDERLLAAEEIHVDQQESRLDARDIQGEHPNRLDVIRLALLHQRVPHPHRVSRRNPDLIAQITGVAGA